MRLLLDMDGPLAAFDQRGWEIIRERKVLTDVDGWKNQTHRYFTDHATTRRSRLFVRKLTQAQGWFRELPVVPGAQEGVQDLLYHDVDLWVCTKPMGTNPYCADEKRAWIAEHFPELTNRLIITPNKSLIDGDVLLDDAPAIEWLPLATWRAVIFNAPFNGAGSQWEDLQHWTWGDPLDLLIETRAS